MTVKLLDGTAVLCITSGCDKPAFYLFSEPLVASTHAAYCELHARQFAERLQLALPAFQKTLKRTTLRAGA